MYSNLLVFVIFSLIAAKGMAVLTAETIEKLKELSKMCQDEAGITDEDVDEALRGSYGKTDKFKMHTFCSFTKLGFFADDGTVVIEKFTQKLKEYFDQSKVDQILSDCMQPKATPLETAWDTSTCAFLIVNS